MSRTAFCQVLVSLPGSTAANLTSPHPTMHAWAQREPLASPLHCRAQIDRSSFTMTRAIDRLPCRLRPRLSRQPRALRRPCCRLGFQHLEKIYHKKCWVFRHKLLLKWLSHWVRRWLQRRPWSGGNCCNIKDSTQSRGLSQAATAISGGWPMQPNVATLPEAAARFGSLLSRMFWHCLEAAPANAPSAAKPR